MDPELLPWPEDAIEHELRSFRRWLRTTFAVMAIQMEIDSDEGFFRRPMVKLTPVNAGLDTTGRRLVTAQRAMALTYFGPDTTEGFSLERDARQKASFFAAILPRGDQANRGPVPVYDWSGDDPVATSYGMEIDASSVSVSMQRDSEGRWAVPVDLRYAIRSGAFTELLPLAPEEAITTVITEINRRTVVP